MRYDLDFHRRTLLLSLLREHVAKRFGEANIAKVERVKAELREEASFADLLAMELDAGEEEKEPVQVDARRDVDNVDPPKEPAN